jgi:hypothetical protein
MASRNESNGSAVPSGKTTTAGRGYATLASRSMRSSVRISGGPAPEAPSERQSSLGRVVPGNFTLNAPKSSESRGTGSFRAGLSYRLAISRSTTTA